MPGFGLIAALVASVAIVIGSSAPWVSALIFTANGTVGDGKLTLAIGLIAAVVLLFAAFGKMQAFSYILAIVAGLLAFAVGAYAAVNIMSAESIDFFGAEISAEIGWGLWMVLIASVALIITAVIAYNQIPCEKAVLAALAVMAVLAGLVLASAAQAYPTMPQGIQGPYTVLKVVDGDTIHVSANGQKLKIRMIGLGTPETVDPRKPVQCFGREASAQAKTILGGQQVYLETDPSQDTIDRFGRTLAYVWIESGRLFNLDMITDGYAFEYTYDLPYRYQVDFKAAENDARTQERGLWSPGACAA